MAHHWGKLSFALFSILVLLGYFFGYFESHVDLLTNSITSGLWIDKSPYPLWNATGFLIPVLDFWLSQAIGAFNYFALIMVFINSASLTVMFWCLLKLSSKLEVQDKYVIALLLWLIIAAPQTLTINSTRIAITGAFSVLLFIHLNYNWNGLLGRIKTLFLVLFTITLSLIRMEAVILIGAVIGVPLFLYHRWSVKFLLPLSVGAFVLMSYNFFFVDNAPDAMKVFYYYETELMDRGGTCVEDAYSMGLLGDDSNDLLTMQDSLSLRSTTLIYHSLPDTGLFQNSFISDVLCAEKIQPMFDWVLGGLDIESWRSCFQTSVEGSQRSFFAFLAALFSLLFIGFSFPRSSTLLYATFLFLLPGLLLFHISIPTRFIVPYYTCYSAICIVIGCAKRPAFAPYAKGIGLLIVLGLIIDEYQWIADRLAKENLIQQNIKSVRDIVKNEKRLVVLQCNATDLFVSQKVSENITPIDSVLFMDEYFTYRMFYEDWKAMCDCNPRSLVERLEFAAKTDAAYLSTEDGVSFAAKYADLLYNSHISFTPQKDFGNEFTRYHIQTVK